MPEFSSARKFEPWSLTASVAFNAEDLRKAFSDQTDPDENLFYAIFSGEWDEPERKLSEKLRGLAQVAELVEGTRAASLNMSAGPPVPKP